MKALITLTPAESKKLIARAFLSLPEFQKARQDGMIALHPCSSTYFIFEALAGRKPEGTWTRGVIIPRGLCISQAAPGHSAAQKPGPHDPRQIRHTWLFRNGRLQEALPIGEILDQMTQSDIYIKGANAVDPAGNVAVLFGNPAGGGGTIGRVIAAQRRTGFHLLLPIGLEKLIPVSIAVAAKAAAFQKYDRAMGIPCGLIPVPGRKIDEVDALAILSGAEATPVAAGGLGGAEGSVVLVINGTEEQVRTAFEIGSSVKGAQLPAPPILDCDVCRRHGCHFSPDWHGR
jgi:hypothetical protein